MSLSLANLCILLVAIFSLAAAEFKRICYYSNWAMIRDRKNALYPENIDPYLCTHVVFAYATLDESGERLNTPREYDDQTIYRRAIKMIRRENANVHCFLGMGGWDHSSRAFHTLLSSEDIMQKFAKNTIKTLRQYDFDGLDIDWQYPGSRGSTQWDKVQFFKFLRLLKWELDHEEHPDLKWTMALTLSLNPKIEDAEEHYWDVPRYSRHVDWIHFKMFDLYGSWDDDKTAKHHSALHSQTDQNNVNNLAKYWTQKGVPRGKIIIGISTLGRSYTLQNPSKSAPGSPITGPGDDGGGGYPYRKICQLTTNGIRENIDPDKRVPYIVVGNQWIGYDNPASAKQKAEIAANNFLGGVMIWAIDNDDYKGECGKPYPLLNAVLDGLGGRHEYNNNIRGSQQDKAQRQRAQKAIMDQRKAIWDGQDAQEQAYLAQQRQHGGRRFW